ncbi:MAG: hypothetical protein PsegKO_01190 [Pseudohongiellaceae bacterium]
MRELRVHECISILSNQHYQVQRHWQVQVAKPFSNQTFDPVALHGSGNMFFGNDDAEP